MDKIVIGFISACFLAVILGITILGFKILWVLFKDTWKSIK